MIYVPALWHTYLSTTIRRNPTGQCSEIHHCQNAFIEFLDFHGCWVGMVWGDLGSFISAIIFNIWKDEKGHPNIAQKEKPHLFQLSLEFNISF